MILFKDLLEKAGLDPGQCTEMLHSDGNPGIRARIMQMFVRDRAMFEIFQSGHGTTADRTLKGRPYCAVFHAQGEGLCIFAGIYRVAGHRTITRAAFFVMPGVQKI